MRSLLALLLLAGCGPAAPDLVGTWEGMLTTTPQAPCSSGGRTDLGGYTILAGPKMQRFGSCINLALEQSGDVARLKPATCPADAVWPAETKVLAGTLTLTGKSLAVDVLLEAGCGYRLTGALTRK